MGDSGDDCTAMTDLKKKHNQEWHTQNRALINTSKIKFTDHGESLLFRLRDKPNVDFYPSTGRWRVAGVNRNYSGGAAAFLTWFANQSAPIKQRKPKRKS